MVLQRAHIRRFPPHRRPRVRFEAEFARKHSLGHFARKLALALLGSRAIDLKLAPIGAWELDPRTDAEIGILQEAFERDASEAVDVHIRGHWPPNFTAPASGRWVLAQPWEFGSLPRAWVEAFSNSVDDVWCLSNHVRRSYLEAGFEAERTAIVPGGVDPEILRPDVKPLELPTQKRFKFLFLGGTLTRKGADVLLQSYLSAFSAWDDVTLLVKDMGTESFYKGQTRGDEFRQAAGDPTRPEVVYLDHFFDEAELAGLYAACDVLVAPYRGEGFGLPVLEAMASGLHVIATAGGATDDFLDGSCGTRLVADRIQGRRQLADGTKCVAPVYLLEPDREELVRALRWAFENRERGKALGRAASQRARSDWTWARAAEVALGRIEEILRWPIRRTDAPRVKSAPEARPASTAPSKRDEREDGTAEAEKADLTALELALIGRDFPSATELLESVLSGFSVSEEAVPALKLAQKVLSSERAYVSGDLPIELRRRLLERIESALGGEARGESDVSRPRVSLTMIVRDEEENIGACLESVGQCVDEIVAVDTGSTDRTRQIARSLGATVSDFAWIDSFAAARNEAIRRASGDWIFWLDADDRVDAQNRARLRELFAELPTDRLVAYSMKVECVAKPGSSPTVVDHVRLFPRHPEIRWAYRVHENILPAINALGGEIAWTDVTIQHVGYLDEELRDRKRDRDHRLLELEFEENPDDPFVHFNLGHSFKELGKLDKARHHLRRSLELSEPHYSQVKKAHVLLSQVEHARGDVLAALRATEEGRQHAPHYPELLFYSGLYLHELGRLDEAEFAFRKTLNGAQAPKEFGSFDAGILDHKAKHCLAKVYLDAARDREAEALLREVRATLPEYLPATMDLARLLVRSDRGPEAAELAGELGEDCPGEGLYLRGQLAERAGELEEAALYYSQALEREPEHEEALRELVHLHLKRGEEGEALACLRRRTEATPDSAAAHFNLAGLLLAQDELEAAERAVRRALSLKPEYELALDLARKIAARREELSCA